MDNPWDNAKNTGSKLNAYHPDTVRRRHAVTLAGYTDDYFTIRNSWGTTNWGDEGFGYASRDYARAAFIGACRINV